LKDLKKREKPFSALFSKPKGVGKPTPTKKIVLDKSLKMCYNNSVIKERSVVNGKKRKSS
jgi:hypothetical protein